MTTAILAARMKRGGLLLALLLVGLVPLFGQGKKKTEISPDMLRTCPDLKDAAGEPQKQLLALYFNLDMDKLKDENQSKEVKRLFNLKSKDVGKVLKKHLFRTKSLRCLHGMRVVFATWGAEGFFWLLKAFPLSSTKGQGRILQVLQPFDFQESYLFLRKELKNKKAMRNKYQEAIAPPGYIPKRICDEAWKLLVYKLSQEKNVWNLPKDWSRARLHPFVPLKIRDLRIEQLEDLLKKLDENWKKWLTEKPSMLKELPEGDKKQAEEFLKKMGISIK